VDRHLSAALMGIGDELMVAGEVKRRAAASARRYAILNRLGEQRYHEVWEGNPRIARPGEPFDEPLQICGGHRPYIDRYDSGRFVWRPYAPEPAEIFFSERERSFADMGRGCVAIEPEVKPRGGMNKQWGRERWQALVDACPSVRWIQIGVPGSRPLRGVRFLPTPSFRTAAAVLSGCSAAVVPEGGLHHAAAAVGTPAVVIFGAFIAPSVTGYATQRSIFVGDGLGCGSRVACPHCRRAMAAIDPAFIAQQLHEVMEGRARRPVVMDALRQEEAMVNCGGVWLPAGETHLVDWMRRRNEVVDGKLTYQYHKLEAALKWVKRWRVAIDVGGHCGLWSMHLAKRFGMVHAFEPVAAHRACFERNLAGLEGRCVLHACALGDASGSVAIHTAPTSSGDSWVCGVGDIPLRTLDGFQPQEVDFIKLDCEGYELFALRGAEEMLRRCKPVVIVEQKPGRAQKFGLQETAAVDYLRSLGAHLRTAISGDYIMAWD
jgi:FkbM family methyltransferase